jgi:hypothetical protein
MQISVPATQRVNGTGKLQHLVTDDILGKDGDDVANRE